MRYIIKPKAIFKIRTFYRNVFKKYRHTFSYENMEACINKAVDSMYLIEYSLLRRRPTIPHWQQEGWHMANEGKWYYAYTIDGDTIIIEDACHAQNMQ